MTAVDTMLVETPEIASEAGAPAAAAAADAVLIEAPQAAAEAAASEEATPVDAMAVETPNAAAQATEQTTATAPLDAMPVEAPKVAAKAAATAEAAAADTMLVETPEIASEAGAPAVAAAADAVLIEAPQAAAEAAASVEATPADAMAVETPNAAAQAAEQATATAPLDAMPVKVTEAAAEAVDAMLVETPEAAAEVTTPAAEVAAVAEPTPPEPAVVEAAGSPQKPKKALSAYWIFSNEMRDEVTNAQTEANGGKAKFGEVAKEISAKWAAMAEADKKAYEDRAAADKQRYASELKAYMEACDPAGTLRLKYQHMIPKKPVTAYFLFNTDPKNREKAAEMLKAEGKEAGSKQLTTKLSGMWKAASAEEKAPYEDQYRKEHSEFVEKQKAWQASPEFAEIERAEKSQEEKRKAAEAEQQAAEAKEKAQKEAKSGKKRSRSAATESTPKAKTKDATENTPQKKTPLKKTPESTPVSDGKRPKKAARTELAAPQIDTKVLAEAAKLGYEGPLQNLAARPEVVASGKSSRALLDALQASKGLVNPAKRALLGA